MQNLDSREEIAKIDKENVLESVESLPDQCLQAWTEASKVVFPQNYKNIENIVVAGMGGSRFTPKTIKELYRDKITKPYEIVEDYNLPDYVNEKSLVILSSYSGTTEEPIACGQDALDRGALVTAVACGGKVVDLVKSNSFPAYVFDPKYNPSRQPRVGSGYMLMGHLGLLKSLGFVDISDSEVLEAIEFLRKLSSKYKVEIDTDQNYAKQLAKDLMGKHPFIITAEFLRGFGNAMANQINETIKLISDYRYIPEMNHHLLEGLKRPESLKENGLFIFFKSNLYSEKIGKRFVITKDVVEQQGVKTKVIELEGKNKLEQVLAAYSLSGFATLYAALLYDTDPVAIPWVDYFKEQLANP